MNPLPCRLFVASTCLFLSAQALVGAPADPAVTPAPGAPATFNQAAASHPATAPKATDHFERTKARIDALLKYRLKPEPLPANPPNPFQLSGAASLATSPEGDATTSDPSAPVDLLPPGSDAESLLLYAAMLKISGTVLLNGRVHLIT